MKVVVVVAMVVAVMVVVGKTTTTPNTTTKYLNESILPNDTCHLYKSHHHQHHFSGLFSSHHGELGGWRGHLNKSDIVQLTILKQY